MHETMPREWTPEEVRRFKALGFFDVGTHYILNGLNRVPKEKPWDEERVKEA